MILAFNELTSVVFIICGYFIEVLAIDIQRATNIQGQDAKPVAMMIQGVAAISNKRPNQDIKKCQKIALPAHQKSNIPRLRANQNLKKGLWKSVLYFFFC